MAGFTKLFGSILTSSIWVLDHIVIRVWVAMLAACDADGVVEGSIPGFAHAAHVTPDELVKVLSILESPDPYSRTQDHEGRRIEAIPGGWKILNYSSYRDRGQGKEGSRAPYMRARRLAKRCNAMDKDVTRYTEAEAEAKADADADANTSRSDRGGNVTPPGYREEGSPETPGGVSTKGTAQNSRFGKTDLDTILGEYRASFADLMTIPGAKVNPRKDAPTYLAVMKLGEVTSADFHSRYLAVVESASEPKYVPTLTRFMSDGRHLIPARPRVTSRNATTNQAPTAEELTHDARSLAERFND